MEANRQVAASPGAPRSGSALLAGLLRCGRCGGHRMTVSHHGPASRFPSHNYHCGYLRADYGTGSSCQHIAGPALDSHITDQLLAAVAPAVRPRARSRWSRAAPTSAALRSPQLQCDGLYIPTSRRVWTLADPASVRGLRDLALDRGPVASHTLYGTQAPAPEIRARMLATARIVVMRDPVGQPLDPSTQEQIKL